MSKEFTMKELTEMMELCRADAVKILDGDTMDFEIKQAGGGMYEVKIGDKYALIGEAGLEKLKKHYKSYVQLQQDIRKYHGWLESTSSEDFMFCNECSQYYTSIGIREYIKRANDPLGQPTTWHKDICPKNAPSCNIREHLFQVQIKINQTLFAYQEKFLSSRITHAEMQEMARRYFPMIVPNNLIGKDTWDYWNNYRVALLEKYGWSNEVYHQMVVKERNKSIKISKQLDNSYRNKDFYKKFRK